MTMQRSNYIDTSVLTFLFQLTYCVKFEEQLRINVHSSEYLNVFQYDLKNSENQNDNQKAFAITQNRLSINRSVLPNVAIRNYCMHLAKSSDSDAKKYRSEFASYDVISDDDVVRNQYKSLPYPYVSEEELLREEAYYQRKTSDPYVIMYSWNLENLNHYLFDGKNDFK